MTSDKILHKREYVEMIDLTVDDLEITTFKRQKTESYYRYLSFSTSQQSL